MEQNKEQQPTIEEVLKKHSGLLLIRAGVNEYAKAAAIDWASIETEHLRQENNKLNGLYESAMTELRSVLKSRSELEQENKTLKEQNQRLRDEWAKESMRYATRIKELEEGISNRDSIMAEVKKLVRTLEQQVKELKD